MVHASPFACRAAVICLRRLGKGDPGGGAMCGHRNSSKHGPVTRLYADRCADVVYSATGPRLLARRSGRYLPDPMPLVNVSGRLRESKVSWRPVKIAQLLLACLVVEWRSECANVEIGNGYAVGDAVLAVPSQIDPVTRALEACFTARRHRM